MSCNAKDVRVRPLYCVFFFMSSQLFSSFSALKILANQRETGVLKMNFINISRSDFLPDKKVKMGVSVFLSILGLFLYQWTNFWEQVANFELPLLLEY